MEVDFKIYITDKRNEADWIVMKTSWKNEAKNGKWFFTDWKNEADIKVFITTNKNEANKIVCFTTWTTNIKF